MAHVSLNEKEHDHKKPKPENLEESHEENDLEADKVEKATGSEERKLEFKASEEDHKKDLNPRKKHKEKLCGFQKEICIAVMIAKSETDVKLSMVFVKQLLCC